MRIDRRLLACGLALAAAVTTAPPASGDSGPAPAYWQGSYGNAEFYGRQIERGADTDRCDGDDLLSAVLDLVAPLLILGSSNCLSMSVVTDDRPGSTFLTEIALCAGTEPPSRISEDFAGRGYETRLTVYDHETGTYVKNWDEPADWKVTRYDLEPGDCVHYLWHLDLETDDGTPFVSGRSYTVIVDHPQGGELFQRQFTAP